jgi:hypothetical protein
MSEPPSLPDHVIHLLRGGDAHAEFDAVVKDIPYEMQGVRPQGSAHSPWEILEHLRIAQWDILEFTRNPAHVSPEFPSGYWPSSPQPPNKDSWQHSVETFRDDLDAMCRLVASEDTNLLVPFPHGSGQTVLREALVLADHNSYHLGELVLLRRLLNAWP